MEAAAVLLMFCLGLLLIVKGGDYFVGAAAWFAEVSGIPKVIVGATVVSLATTLPEILVSTLAAVNGKSAMAMGNAVGSVTANLGLTFALSAVFAPFAFSRKEYAVKSILMLLAVATLCVFSLHGHLHTAGLVLLLCIFGMFLFENLRGARASLTARTEVGFAKPKPKEVAKKTLDFLLGVLGITLGARLLVNKGSELALMLGVPEGVIAVTVIAVGTSLPELVTAIASIVKKQGALSVGNILGANIIDTTLIIPVCGFVHGEVLPFSAQGIRLDLPFCLIMAALASLPMLLFSKTTKSQGIAMLAVYGIYFCFLFL